MNFEVGFGGRVVTFVATVEGILLMSLLLGGSAGKAACLFAVPFVSLPGRASVGAAFSESESNGVVLVGAIAMTCSIKSGTLAGVTPSTIVKAGRSRTIVGLSFES